MVAFVPSTCICCIKRCAPGKFIKPAPCSNIDAIFDCSGNAVPLMGLADSIKTCFMEAGFSIQARNSSGIELDSNVTAPATTGEAALVPPRRRHPATFTKPFLRTVLALPRRPTEKVTWRMDAGDMRRC